MPRLFLILLIPAMCAMFGCTDRQRDPRAIEFWTLQLSPAFDPYIHGLIASFEQEHPGARVVWVDVPFEGITQKLLSAIAAGTPPDVINLPADYVTKYSELGILRPLDGLVPDSVRQSHIPSAVKPMMIQGQLYGLPWYLATKILIWNRAKLGRFSPDPPVPDTFDSLLAWSQSYHARTGEYAFFYNVAVDSYLLQVLASEGVSLLDADGQHAGFATPLAATILDHWVAAFRAGAMPRECLLVGHRGGIDLYQSGSIAMFVGAPQFLRIVRENAPAIYQATQVSPAPVGRAGKTELDVMAVAVSATSIDPIRAADFALFVTNARNQLAFARIVPILPSHREALRDSLFCGGEGGIESDARQIAAAQLATAEVLKPLSRHYPKLQEAFKDAMLKVFLGDVPSAEALRRAASAWDKILEE